MVLPPALDPFGTALLAAALFCGITLLSIKDEDLFTNRLSLKLPIVDVSIGATRFLLISPILLTALFLYFQYANSQIFPVHCRTACRSGRQGHGPNGRADLALHRAVGRQRRGPLVDAEQAPRLDRGWIAGRNAGSGVAFPIRADPRHVADLPPQSRLQRQPAGLRPVRPHIGGRSNDHRPLHLHADQVGRRRRAGQDSRAAGDCSRGRGYRDRGQRNTDEPGWRRTGCNCLAAIS